MRAFLRMQIFYQKLLLLAIYIFMDVPYSTEEGIEREAFALSVGGGEDGISGCSGREVSGCNDIGCNPCGLFGEAA